MPRKPSGTGASRGNQARILELEKRQTALARLQVVLPALAAMYLAIAARTFLLTPGPERETRAYWTLAIAAAGIGAWAMANRRRIPDALVQPVAMILAVMCAAHAVGGLKTGAEPASAIVFVLVGACGFILSSTAWYVVTAASLVGLWAWVARAALVESRFFHLFTILCFGALASGGLVLYRGWRMGRTLRSDESEGLDRQFRREYFEKAVQGTSDGLWYWDLRSDQFHVSRAWAKLMGHDVDELERTPEEWFSRVHPGYMKRLREELAELLDGDGVQFRNEHRMRRKDGTYVWVMARASVIRDSRGKAIVLAGSHTDITPVMEAEKRMLTDSFQDKLTGLSNRAFLVNLLEMAVNEKRSKGNAAPLFAVMFLDLDRFKQINDTMGHQVGDELLVAVAGRLKNCARPDDVVARFGGDEFVLLLRHLRDQSEAMHVGERIRNALTTPYQLGERVIQSGGSVGIALSTAEFRDAEELLHFGDVAMYHAKTTCKGSIQVFDRRLAAATTRRSQLHSELGGAIARGELLLHYQPCLHMASGRVAGLEALLRWQRQNGELLLPGEFLPIAEENGLIEQIGDWVLRTACAQNSAWQRAGLAPVRMAVNLAPRQLQRTDLHREVQNILHETGLRSEWLELELNEAALSSKNGDRAASVIRTLSENGIRTAIDNFGAGDASIHMLRQLPFQTLKLDKAFVNALTIDQRSAAMARGVISIAHHLNLAVVAEGVEQKEQLQFLSAERCDQVQGYLIGRPSPSATVQRALGGGSTPTLLTPDQAAAPSPQNGALNWAAQRSSRQ